MFGDGFFDMVPDMDWDGDHDATDFWLKVEQDQRMREEREARDAAARAAYSTVDWDIDEDSDVDPYEFDTEEDYLDAVEEEKHKWRENLLGTSDVEVDPEDYETEDEYNDAVEMARREREEDIEDCDLLDLDYDVFDTKNESFFPMNSRNDSAAKIIVKVSVDDSDSIKDKALYDEVCQIREKEKYISAAGYNADALSRRNEAIDKLMDGARGYSYGIDIPRCRFILKDNSIAARYLTVDGAYLYARAIKDHFNLPFDTREYDERNMPFDCLLGDLAEDNLENAMNIWSWCLDTFMPYIQYAEYKSELTHSVLFSLSNFVDEFTPHIVDYMNRNPDFIEKLILKCINTPCNIDELIVIALKAEYFDTAKRIMECAFACEDVGITDKANFIKTTIEACMDWDEVETIEAFQQHIFPLVFAETDVRIKNKIDRWQKQMTEHIRSVERRSDRYAYSRVYAWRQKYREAFLDPTRYETEEEYLAKVKEKKYGWRKYCNKRYGVSPEDYETRDDYEEAVKIAIERENQIMREVRYFEKVDTQPYRFCKVSMQHPYKPYYYYLTGDIEVSIGDSVVVPFGRDNRPSDAIVVSVGECLGCTFPCNVSDVKFIIEKKSV